MRNLLKDMGFFEHLLSDAAFFTEIKVMPELVAVVEGRFDGFVSNLAYGWASIVEDRSLRVVVQLFIDGVFADEKLADALRGDVLAAGYGDGRYGFGFELPDSLQDGQTHSIAIRVKDTGLDMPYSPRLFSSYLHVDNELFSKNLPWIDLDHNGEDILRRLTTREISVDTAKLLAKWHDDGYVIMDDVIDAATIKKINSDIDQAVLDRAHVLYQGQAGITSFKDLRHEQIIWDHSRILEFHSVSEAAAEAIMARSVIDFTKLVLGGEPVAMQSLLFMKGSTQRAHMEFPYVHTPFPAYLMASWIALEDVREDAGPLFYFPKSHRLVPKFDFGFGNLLAYSDGWHVRDFEEYLDATARRLGLELKLFMAKSGQVLLWHSALVHGGMPRLGQDATRRSLVAHYSPRNIYSRDRRYPDRDPLVVSRNGGVFYDFQGEGDPKLRFRLME